jgi:hypothetical protein
MTLPRGMVQAKYINTEISQYQGNPLIEALPPILDVPQLQFHFTGQIRFNPKDINLEGQTRIHIIAQLLDGFFQPLVRHFQLESKLSIMLRQGYVGRNLDTGELNAHIQNGYERIMQGNLDVFRFDHVKSTAKSLAFIGCSGSGKTSSVNRILETYPHLIYHEKYNITQIVFLKIDCPHDGSLKSLCHNFFREIDAVLSTNYVRLYVEKRNGVETLIALMAHIANTYAIGLLVIDEIQHLSARRSGGAEHMLNFFVTLVNEISVPVVMVGTPKARSVFELDLRSARRGAGFGSILWEPLSKPSHDQDISRTEWGNLTSQLWKLQWLRNATLEITEEIRDTWYDLSQGIMDIVVKLFVLSQIRAVVTGVERITPELMNRVYKDEFKPIHPMIEALRSGDEARIASYSDLTIPDVHIKIIELSNLLQAKQNDINAVVRYQGNNQAIYLHNTLVDMGYESRLLEPLINSVFEEYPELAMKDLLPIIIYWYRNDDAKKPKSSIPKVPVLKQLDWPSLNPSDLRFLFSKAANGEEFQKSLKREGVVFDIDSWIDSFG